MELIFVHISIYSCFAGIKRLQLYRDAVWGSCSYIYMLAAAGTGGASGSSPLRHTHTAHARDT